MNNQNCAICKTHFTRPYYTNKTDEARLCFKCYLKHATKEEKNNQILSAKESHHELFKNAVEIVANNYRDFMQFILICNGSGLVAVLAFAGTTWENSNSIPLFLALLCFGIGLIAGLFASMFQLKKNKLRQDQLEEPLHYWPEEYSYQALKGTLFECNPSSFIKQNRYLKIANILGRISLGLFILGMIVGIIELRNTSSNRTHVDTPFNYSIIINQ